MPPLKLMVTLWPSFEHFAKFAVDDRLSGIRLNSAMMDPTEIREELEIVAKTHVGVPLYFDVKGRQLRITEFHFNEDHLDISLNHPISVETPTPVLFKGGSEGALLMKLEEDGTRLIFEGGPPHLVKPGESLHIRHRSLQVHGDLFTPAELEKIEIVLAAGFTRYFLSYVESQADVNAFRELVGHDAELCLKIENVAGLDFVEHEFVKTANTRLIAARGDLYVEVGQPHDILAALKLIISKDPEACAGSRILLSVVNNSVPECADFSELAWLYDIGYREMMLCDELCLKDELLSMAVNVFDSFRSSYAIDEPLAPPLVVPKRRRGRLMRTRS